MCKQAELFIFGRFERGTATYLAMETGHTKSMDTLAPRLEGLVGAAST